MKAKKHALKSDIEEGDAIKEDDDRKHAIKGKIEEGALEHHDHPQAKAIQLDNQIDEEEAPEPRGVSLSSGSSSCSTAPSVEHKGLPCQRCFRRMKQYPNYVCVIKRGAQKCMHCRSTRQLCLELPYAVRANATRALAARPARQRVALSSTAQPRRQSTYGYSDDMNIDPISTGSSGATGVPPCPRFYHTPMTNDLRYQDMKTIEVVRDGIQTMLNRTTWEVEKLTEHLNELATEKVQEDLSAWV